MVDGRLNLIHLTNFQEKGRTAITVQKTKSYIIYNKIGKLSKKKNNFLWWLLESYYSGGL